MYKSILEEFARGNINPAERPLIRNSHGDRAARKLVDSEDKLLAALNEREKELFKSFDKAQADISEISGVEMFVHGYRLGVLMTTEVFDGKSGLIATA